MQTLSLKLTTRHIITISHFYFTAIRLSSHYDDSESNFANVYVFTLTMTARFICLIFFIFN